VGAALGLNPGGSYTRVVSHPTLLSRAVFRPVPVAAMAALGVAMSVVAWADNDAAGAMAAVGTIVGEALPVALCWMASAFGLGLLLAPALGFRGAPALACALGVAVLAWVDHLLGVMGVLSPMASWAMLVPGWVGLVAVVHRRRAARMGGREAGARVSWWMVLGAPAVGLMVGAACLPPGSIWGSEARGYDVLSYHLQLPKEWLAQGRVWPVAHNVYSFLPSFMEAVFARLGAMRGVTPASAVPLGAGPGVPVYAAQMMHVLMAVVAAWGVVTVVRVIACDEKDTPRQAGRGTGAGAWCAGAAGLGVPWVVVTGSMAYNELAVCALLAGAVLGAWPREVSGWRRGVVVGLLIGAACGMKPTAMFLAMPVAAVVLAARTLRREWVGALGAASIAGAVMLAPWMVRNWMATGNPVFPAMASVFGMGHWTAEQHARWHAAHHVDLSIGARLARVWSEEFGVLHAQWSIWAIVVVGAMVVCLAVPRVRRQTWPVMVGLLVQLIAWMAIGHLQSRFLVPVVVTSGVVVGAALDAVWRRNARLGVALGVVVPLILVGDAVRLFLRENGGAPTRGLIAGVEVFNGSGLASPGHPDVSREVKTFYLTVGPTVWMNHILLRSVPEPRVLMIGDATPLYIADAGARVVYATTWDAGPLTRALDAAKGDPDGAIAHLREEQGFTHLLIHAAELDRLRDSGFADARITPELGLALARRSRMVISWPDRGTVVVALDRSAVDSAPP
jgi:hypothetical protein